MMALTVWSQCLVGSGVGRGLYTQVFEDISRVLHKLSASRPSFLSARNMANTVIGT
jgi:hypothetical protein